MCIFDLISKGINTKFCFMIEKKLVLVMSVLFLTSFASLVEIDL